MTSRRNFLTGSVAAAAATFASATHAAPVMKPAKFDETFDFVVVGAGGAGLCAAAHAAEKGIGVELQAYLWFVGISTSGLQGDSARGAAAESTQRVAHVSEEGIGF